MTTLLNAITAPTVSAALATLLAAKQEWETTQARYDESCGWVIPDTAQRDALCRAQLRFDLAAAHLRHRLVFSLSAGVEILDALQFIDTLEAACYRAAEADDGSCGWWWLNVSHAEQPTSLVAMPKADWNPTPSYRTLGGFGRESGFTWSWTEKLALYTEYLRWVAEHYAGVPLALCRERPCCRCGGDTTERDITEHRSIHAKCARSTQ